MSSPSSSPVLKRASFAASVGSTLVSHKPHLTPRHSRVKKPPQVVDVYNNVMNNGKLQEQVLRVPVDDARPNLINMKCRYFFSFTGCTRPDCRFLHEEPIKEAVFHDGSEETRFRGKAYISPGPRAEVKIFVGNLSAETETAFIIDLASPCGEVKSAKILPSKLKYTRRCAAILYMSSDAQADAAIDAINAYIDERGECPYARKEYSRPIEVGPPVHLKQLMEGTKLATITVKKATAVEQEVNASLLAPKKKILHASPTSVLCGDWSDAERRLRAMSPFKMPPPKIVNPWDNWYIANKNGRWSDA